MSPTQVPEPGYINLEYLFERFFNFIRFLGELVLNFSLWLSGLGWLSIIICFVLLVLIIYVILRIMNLRRRKVVHLADVIVREEIPEMRVNKWDEIEKMPLLKQIR
jgi:hypothetical protein